MNKKNYKCEKSDREISYNFLKEKNKFDSMKVVNFFFVKI